MSATPRAMPVWPRSFSRSLLLQFLRAVAGWPVTVGGMEMPIWPSWVAFVVAAGLAWLGFKSKA